MLLHNSEVFYDRPKSNTNCEQVVQNPENIGTQATNVAEFEKFQLRIQQPVAAEFFSTTCGLFINICINKPPLVVQQRIHTWFQTELFLVSFYSIVKHDRQSFNYLQLLLFTPQWPLIVPRFLSTLVMFSFASFILQMWQSN